MTDWSYVVHDRNVAAISLVDGVTPTVVILPWTPDPFFGAQSLPWPEPEFPTLLILGIGVSLTTSAVAGNRRLDYDIINPNNAQTLWRSSGVQTANLTRRWEIQVGFSLETTLAGDTYREPLPNGLLLFGQRIPNDGQFRLAVNGAQAGDALGALSLRGRLLYP